MRQALKDLGRDLPFERVDSLARRSLEMSFELWAEECNLDAQMIKERFRVHFYAIPPELQPPFPGVLDLCKFVCQKGGMNFIFTHRQRLTLTKLLQAYGMQPYFQDMVTSDEEYPRKPDPAGLLAIMQKYRLASTEVLMIGDREIDIQAGKNAKVATCLFGAAWGNDSADYHFWDYPQFKDWLELRSLA